MEPRGLLDASQEDINAMLKVTLMLIFMIFNDIRLKARLMLLVTQIRACLQLCRIGIVYLKGVFRYTNKENVKLNHFSYTYDITMRRITTSNYYESSAKYDQLFLLASEI